MVVSPGTLGIRFRLRNIHLTVVRKQRHLDGQLMAWCGRPRPSSSRTLIHRPRGVMLPWWPLGLDAPEVGTARQHAPYCIRGQQNTGLPPDWHTQLYTGLVTETEVHARVYQLGVCLLCIRFGMRPAVLIIYNENSPGCITPAKPDRSILMKKIQLFFSLSVLDLGL